MAVIFVKSQTFSPDGLTHYVLISPIMYLSHPLYTYLTHYILDEISHGHGELLDARHYILISPFILQSTPVNPESQVHFLVVESHVPTLSHEESLPSLLSVPVLSSG